MTSFTAVPKADYPVFSYKERRFVTRLQKRCEYLADSKSKALVNEFNSLKWLLRGLRGLGSEPKVVVHHSAEDFRRLETRRDYLEKKEKATSYELEELPALVWAMGLLDSAEVSNV